MELNLKRNLIKTSEIIYEGNVSNQIENEITLPDYCQEIQKILKCCLIPGITSTHISGNRVNADVNAVVRIIYLDENNNLKSYETRLSFSKYVENDDITSEDFSIVKANTEYVNCRVISPRKISITGSVNISFKIFSKSDIEYLSDVEDDDVKLKKCNKNITILNGKVEKSFSLSEIIELPADKDSIKSILNVSANATVRDLKNIKSKTLLKGDLNVNITYLTRTGENEIESISHSMPINQIIESENIDEDCTYNVYLEIQSLEIMTKTDSSGEERILEINSEISAVISAYKEQDFYIIKDAYSITSELEKTENDIELKRLLSTVTDNAFVHGSIDLQAKGMKQVIYAWYGDISINSDLEDNKYKISGSVDISILGINNDDQIIYEEGKIDYEYSNNIEFSSNKVITNPIVQITAFEYNHQNKNLDIKLELFINVDIISVEFERAIYGLTINENEQNSSYRYPLTVYFPDVGESIWNIAKKYNTTVEAIMLENNLSDEIIGEKQMLLIPAI